MLVATATIACLSLLSFGELCLEIGSARCLGTAKLMLKLVHWETERVSSEIDLISLECRNSMMGASFQASISALFFNTLLDILLSPKKLAALQSFAVKDPLLEAPDEPADNPASIRIGQVSALAVIVLNLAVILLSMLLFSVSVRLSIHTGYYYKACGHENALISVQDAVKLTLETQVGTQLLKIALHIDYVTYGTYVVNDWCEDLSSTPSLRAANL